jgi:hypothetical protein
MNKTPSVYWQGIYDFESQRAAELRQGVFEITDDEGNDLVPSLITQHEEKAAMAKAQLDFLARRQTKMPR